MSLIIGLSGWRRSGKDTVGNYLASTYGFKKLSFAGALKDSASELFEVDRKLFDDDSLKDKPVFDLPLQIKTDKTSQCLVGMLYGEFSKYNNEEYFSPRTLCILLGAVGRVVNNSFWVKKAINNLNAHENYVITDLRFSNEIEAMHDTIKFHKIHTVRINRFVNIASNNPSERDLDNYIFDHHLDNTENIQHLHSQVDRLVKGLL